MWTGICGFSIDASVRIQGEDRAGVERLLRYCARPPFALERLHALGGAPSLASPQARLLYLFPRPTPDGRTEIFLSPQGGWMSYPSSGGGRRRNAHREDMKLVLS